jgi:hypothetical protein
MASGGARVFYSTHEVTIAVPKKWLSDPVPADIWGTVTAVCGGRAAVRFRMYGEEAAQDGVGKSIRIGIVNKGVDPLRVRFISFDIKEEALNIWDSFEAAEVEEVEGGAELSLSCPDTHDVFDCLSRNQGATVAVQVTIGIELVDE